MAESVWSSWDLDCNATGTPRPTLSNAVKVFEHDPAISTRFWYDEFLDRILTGEPAREWTDADDLTLTVELQDRIGLSTIPSRIVADAVQQYASRRPRHVFRDWLVGLEWDREPRIAMAFEDHWGVTCNAAQPADYVRAVSANFFVGMAARIFRPGCQLDTMVVFEGKQGIGKTSALRTLAGPYYALSYESVGSKDFLQSLRGKLIVEIGELDSLGRADVTRVKSTLSNTVDTYRPSYGRRPRDYPRQSIFAGTTNVDEWGSDDTGLRRFWPVLCGEINVKSLAAARVQLFAEAVHAFESGATWWEVPEAATRVQADRYLDHPWTARVLRELGLESETTMEHVLGTILKLDTSQHTMMNQKIVGSILRAAGWKKRLTRARGTVVKRWFSPTTEL